MVEASGPDCVVADPLRFKQRLQIGEDAYVILRAKKRLVEVWDTIGAAGAGAGIAASAPVAGMFATPTLTSSALGLFGITTAASTPVGWVVAAALLAGGGYLGVSRLLQGAKAAAVIEIPQFINTPIDVLGMKLFDLLGSLAVRVSAIDGYVHPSEIQTITDHFCLDWGYDRTYVDWAIKILQGEPQPAKIKFIARNLARFTTENPDCNAQAMQSELLRFLKEVVAADGVIDEREELALDAIEAVLREENAITLEKISQTAKGVGKDLGDIASSVASDVGNFARKGFSKLMQGKEG